MEENQTKIIQFTEKGVLYEAEVEVKEKREVSKRAQITELLVNEGIAEETAQVVSAILENEGII